MYLSRGEKITLALIVIMIVLIPSGSFLLAQRFNVANSNKKNVISLDDLAQITNPQEVPDTSPLTPDATTSPSPTPTSDSELSFGPVLKFGLKIEGRPTADQSTKAFLGIASGEPTTNPKYLLSFNVDVPADGGFKGVSLAGLDNGSTYTAYLKAPSQIATSSAFVARPTSMDLGILNLITGDINEDNVIDTNDYNVAKSALRSTPTSQGWNPILDFNKDNIVNNIDLSFIVKNLNRIGASGPWYSRINNPTTGGPEASGSGSLYEPVSGQEVILPNGQGGYWFFLPKP